jgi:hypothetical protein
MGTIVETLTSPIMPTYASPVTGEFSLILGLAARRQNAILIQQCLRRLAETCSDKEAKWTIDHTKASLTDRQKDWLEGTLRKLWDDPQNNRKRPVHSYLWGSVKSEGLNCELHTRVTHAESEALWAIARKRGVSRAQLQRDIIRVFLQQQVVSHE